MGAITKIEWADHSWSPWRGCTKVSPGCTNCYAEGLSNRFGKSWGGWGKDVPRVLSKSWKDPIRWDAEASRTRSRTRVFPSLCDWLDEETSVEWLAEFLRLIRGTPNLDWLLLTKRPEAWGRRISAALAHVEGITDSRWPDRDPNTETGCMLNDWLAGNAPKNVWFGVSVEDPNRAEERIPLLLGIPARIRWLSVEPLIGPVNVGQWCRPRWGGKLTERGTRPLESECLDWVVVGGESGPKARPCNVDWVRDIVSKCKGAAVPVFVKQVGSNPYSSPTDAYPWSAIRDGKGGEPSEWPKDLRVREFPV